MKRMQSCGELSLPEMDINKMLAELRTERVQVEEAIVVLARLARGRAKGKVGGCGRPP